jgi:hypothetical protein
MMTQETMAVVLDESLDSEAVVEVELLLYDRQLAALEAAAHKRGLTAAGLVRHLIGEFLSGPDAGCARARH